MKENIPLYTLHSAWKGHENFAIWLVDQLNPKTIVELGVDYGFSTFAFAMPEKGHVFGIDKFGPTQIDTYGDSTTFPHVIRFMSKYNFTNVSIIQGFFSEIAQWWELPIDILHIDGTHTYNDMTEDWQDWSKFLSEHGVILMHDVVSYDECKLFYNEIQIPKAYFKHSHGLGIATRSNETLNLILKHNPGCVPGNI